MHTHSDSHISRADFKVMLVDGDTRVDIGLRHALARCGNLRLVAEAHSESQAFEQAQSLHPSLVILGGLEAGDRLLLFVRRLRKLVPEIPIFPGDGSLRFAARGSGVGLRGHGRFFRIGKPGRDRRQCHGCLRAARAGGGSAACADLRTSPGPQRCFR